MCLAKKQTNNIYQTTFFQLDDRTRFLLGAKRVGWEGMRAQPYFAVERDLEASAVREDRFNGKESTTPK